MPTKVNNDTAENDVDFIEKVIKNKDLGYLYEWELYRICPKCNLVKECATYFKQKPSARALTN